MDTTGHLVDTDAADLTLEQAARRAGCSVKTVRRAIAGGQLPHHRVRGRRGVAIIVQPADVDAWLAARDATLALSPGQSTSDQTTEVSTSDHAVQQTPAEAPPSMDAALVMALSTAVQQAVAPLWTELNQTAQALGEERERRRAAEARAAELERQLTEERVQRRRPWWRRWWGRSRREAS